jgi:hypothetical protein
MKISNPKLVKILQSYVNPVEMAIEFLQHEFRKFFPDQKDEFYLNMDRLIQEFPETRGEETFWFIVAGISEGYALKYVHRRLTDSKYAWSLEKVKLDDLTMTGMSPFMNPILEKASWKPSNFAKIWRENPDLAKAPEAEDMRLYPERDIFPIFVRENKEHKLSVFDGMRRTCMAALRGDSDILAYVGRVVNPKGKPLLNRDKALFLRLMYDEIPKEDLKLLDAIKIVMRAYQKYYRNGLEVVENVMHKWKKDPKLVKVAEEILKS